MDEHCDILIIGAGTAGVYFGWQMARRGHSVVIVERSERAAVGRRLDVFHIDSVKFAEFGVPPPEEDSPEFCVVLEEGISYSPEGKYPKVVKYPFHVMRLPLFLQRMFALAESEGVELAFETAFSGLVYEDGKIAGAVVEREGEQKTLRARLVVDASGINAVVRTALPPDYGVENFKIAPDEKFYVVLRYVTWLDPQRPRTVNSEGWTFYKAWIAPSFHERGGIIGIGATGSYDRAEEVFKQLTESISLPPSAVSRRIDAHPTRSSGMAFCVWETAPASPSRSRERASAPAGHSARSRSRSSIGRFESAMISRRTHCGPSTCATSETRGRSSPRSWPRCPPPPTLPGGRTAISSRRM